MGRALAGAVGGAIMTDLLVLVIIYPLLVGYAIVDGARWLRQRVSRWVTHKLHEAGYPP